MQDHVINTNNYKKYVSKDQNITNNTCKKCREKSEPIQHITAAYRALAQGHYSHRHIQAASIVHKDSAIKCGLSGGKPTTYYKYEPQSVSDNSHYKVYLGRSITTNRTIHNNTQDTVMLDTMI
jgi:hypothetical protein